MTTHASLVKRLESYDEDDQTEYHNLDDPASLDDDDDEVNRDENEPMAADNELNFHEIMNFEILDETFATVQEEDNDDVDEKDDDDDNRRLGLDSALSILQSILKQITLNDSPPVNEEMPFSPLKVTGKTPKSRGNLDLTDRTSLKKGSRQQHALSPCNGGDIHNKLSFSPTESASVSSSDATSTLSSLGWSGQPSLETTNETVLSYQMRYQKSQSRAEMKMGNVALATLCHCTVTSLTHSDLIRQVHEPEDPVLDCVSNENRKPDLMVDTGMPVSPKKNRGSPTKWMLKKFAPLTKKVHPPHPPPLSPKSPKNTWLVRNNKSPRNVEPPGALTKTFSNYALEADELESEMQDALRLEEELMLQSISPSFEPNSKADSHGYHGDPGDHYRAPEDHHQDHQLQEDILFSHSEEVIVEETDEDVANDAPSPPAFSGAYTPNYTPSRAPHLHLSTDPFKQPRLQMFGSEYARFLSSTALAPDQRRRNLKTLNVIRQPTWRRNGQPRHRQYRSVGGDLSMRLGRRTLNIEDADSAVLTGAITDILVTHGDEVPPKGYYRISQTPDGDEFNALLRNTPTRVPGGRTTQVYINVKKEANWDRAAQRPCVTALAVIFPDRKEFVPPGFCVVRKYEITEGESSKSTSFNSANLNFGSNGERVYLCYRRSREGNPITGVLPLQPSNDELIPEGYTVLERTPRNHVADINSKAGQPVFLAFRQRLASLEPLRPLPLLLSVYHDAMLRSTPEEYTDRGNPQKRLRAIFRRSRLQAYYCTGGTVVGSEVGRFHIMDRSTHPLLSPSSVTNRLTLIEASRQKASSAIPKLVTPNNKYRSSSDSFAKSNCSDSSMGQSTTQSLHESTLGDYLDASRSMTTEIGLGGDADASFGVGSRASFSTSSDFLSQIKRESFGSEADGNASTDSSNVMHFASISTMSQSSQLPEEDLDRIRTNTRETKENSTSLKSYFCYDDLTLKMCLAVLSFIPPVKSATGTTKQLDARAALLTPILTACYTHHGGASLIAVEGLITLLKETDFFTHDVSIEGSNSRLTLLDLSIQAVCDVATSSARETSFGTCIEFVQLAVKLAKGQLNTRTAGYVLRFYLFIFYFGANIPTLSSAPNPLWTTFDKDGENDRSAVAADDVAILSETFNDDRMRKYLPGGAPQAAVLALKEMITLLLSRISTMSLNEALQMSKSADGILCEHDLGDTLGVFISGIISQLIDSATSCVDLANFNQLALHQIHRSGGSELFWYDMMTSCGSGLFGNLKTLAPEMRNILIINFALLANLVKISSGKIRKMSLSGTHISRDVASKMLSLELLYHFLKKLDYEATILRGVKEKKDGDMANAVQIMVFSVRRLVVPCLLTNTACGLQDARIFRRMMQIISMLWQTPLFRRHLKMELGVLIEHFGLGILQLDPQILAPHRMNELNPYTNDVTSDPLNFGDIVDPLFHQQIDLLFEVKRWFKGDCRDIVELYLNFDTDISSSLEGPNQLIPGTQWKLCQQLCGSTCSLIQKSSDFIAQQAKESQSSNSGPISPSNAEAVVSPHQVPDATPNSDAIEVELLHLRARQLQKAAIETAIEMMKCFATSAARALGKRTEAGFLRESFDEQESAEPCTEVDVVLRDQGNNGILNYWQTAIAGRRTASSARQRTRPAPSQIQQGQSSDPQYVYEGQGSVCASVNDRNRRTMDYSKTSGADASLQIAFEMAQSKSLKKAIEYLIAENFLSPSPRDIAAFLRIHHAKFDPTMLGEYLGEGGLEADEEHWNLIRFNYVRAIAFVGLNAEQGLRHFLTNCGFRLPGEAQRIDRIITTFSQCYWEDNAGDLNRCPFSDQDVVFLISFAIIMLNTDLHKRYPSHMKVPKSMRKRKVMTKAEFMNNLRGVDNNEELSHEYIGMIYDSIEASPIELFDDPSDRNSECNASSSRLSSMSSSRASGKRDLASMLKAMLKNVKKSEELLRGIAVHEYSLYTVNDYSNSMDYDTGDDVALSDLVHSALSTMWHHFHGLIQGALNNSNLDPQSLFLSLDVLKYAVCATILLDMQVERTAFLIQLARIKTFSERRSVRSPDQSFMGEAWYRDLVVALEDPCLETGNLHALSQIHVLFDDLTQSLKEDTHMKRGMARVARRIRDGQFLLNDPSRAFIKEGDLMKKGSKLGRSAKYRFFLFSDLLLYTKASSSSLSTDYKILDEFPLYMMKIVDWFPPSKPKLKLAFSIHHPRKSLLVFCSNEQEKREWVRSLQDTIQLQCQLLANANRNTQG